MSSPLKDNFSTRLTSDNSCHRFALNMKPRLNFMGKGLDSLQYANSHTSVTPRKGDATFFQKSARKIHLPNAGRDTTPTINP